MKRRAFIQKSALTVAGCAVYPLSSLQLDIPSQLLLGKERPDLYGEEHSLLREAHIAFEKMKTAARKEGIEIKTVSSYRSYAHQKRIWERKYKKFIGQGYTPEQSIEKIVAYSTIPGTSRHHWGTDLDIVDANATQPSSLLLERHFHGSGPFCKLREWLEKHAASFRFHLVYTNNSNRQGFKYEPWHYSYAPLSIPYLQAFKQLDIKKELEQSSLLGHQFLSENFIDHYITNNLLDINPVLLES